MKKLFSALRYILIVGILLFLALKLTGTDFLLKGVWATYFHGHNTASIDDAKFFEIREIEASSDSWQWPLHEDYNKVELSAELESSLKETESVAFLITHNDQIINEYYWGGYSDSSLSNSFSMAKSVVTLLTQIAIQNGILKGWNQKVIDFFPELTGEFSKDVELYHLSTMSAGMHWDEHYTNPFGITAEAYYGDDISELILSLPIDKKPGQEFYYQSGAPQLLAMVLIKATGKSLSELTSEWLWKPLQAKHDAYWHVDHENGTELAYCCYNSNARDFARFGKLMRNMGNWNGTQLLDSSFVSVATVGQLAPQYGYAFWVDDSHGTPVYYQRGVLGQYIITIPEYGLNIVRLGHHRGPHEGAHSKDFKVIVTEVLKRFRKD